MQDCLYDSRTCMFGQTLCVDFVQIRSTSVPEFVIVPVSTSSVIQFARWRVQGPGLPPGLGGWAMPTPFLPIIWSGVERYPKKNNGLVTPANLVSRMGTSLSSTSGLKGLFSGAYCENNTCWKSVENQNRSPKSAKMKKWVSLPASALFFLKKNENHGKAI